jgi:hypothetical protein
MVKERYHMFSDSAMPFKLNEFTHIKVPRKVSGKHLTNESYYLVNVVIASVYERPIPEVNLYISLALAETKALYGMGIPKGNKFKYNS